MRQRDFYKFFRYLIFGFLLGLALLFSYLRVFELYELQTYDWRCQVRGARPVSKDVVLIDIWDDTLRNLGAWPFDRHYHAELIDVLGHYGAKAVGFDLLFVEPREGDEAVAQAAARAKNVYFAEAFYQPRLQDGAFAAEKKIAPLLPSYTGAAAGVGHVNAKADLDGKRRRVYPFIVQDGRKEYQLSLQIAKDLFGVKEEEVVLSKGRLRFSKDRAVPLDGEGCLLVNYAGPWQKTFRHYSYYDILAAYLEGRLGLKPRLDLEAFKDKICFVGLTSLGSHDTSPVPIEPVYPMVGMYANVLSSLLQRDFIHRPSRLFNLFLLLVFGAGVLWIAFRLKPVLALLGTLGVLFLFIGGVTGVFLKWGIWLDLFYPCVFFAFLYAASTLTRVMQEVRKREIVERELEIASQIQKSFLPAVLPKREGLDLAVYMKPAKAVGGDLYAFMPLADGRMGVMVGDVSGKGTPAALLMAKAVSEFKFFARDTTDPAEALQALNDSLALESAGGLFVTLTYALFDIKNRELLLSSAGHLPVLRVNLKGETDFLTEGTGIPLGIVEGVSFPRLKMEMQEGDRLIFYSDGISEARNRKKEEYGVEKLQRVAAAYRSFGAEALLERTMADVHRFVGRADQHDDMTLLIAGVRYAQNQA